MNLGRPCASLVPAHDNTTASVVAQKTSSPRSNEQEAISVSLLPQTTSDTAGATEEQ